MLMQKGFTIWYTGVAGSGKTTLSNRVHHRLKKLGVTNVEVLDADDATTHLSKGLGHTKEDIDTHAMRLGWVAQVLTKNNIPNIISAVSPFRDSRDEVRRLVEHAGGKGSFIEVFVDCPPEVSSKREDAEKRKRREAARNKGGPDAEYEKPHNPEVHIRTDNVNPDEGADMVIAHLKSAGLI